MMLSCLLDALIPVAVDTANYVVEFVEPDFWQAPKYIWENIFAVLDVLVVGLLLAYIASRYQYRKEVEWKLRGDLLEKRVGSYQKISSFIYDLANQHDPTEQEEEQMEGLLGKLDLNIPAVKYADIYSSLEKFNDFRTRLDLLITQEKLFLDYPTLLHLEKLRFYFDTVSEAIDGFIEAEHNPINKFSSAQLGKHIDIGLKSFGVAMNNDMSKWYGITDQLLAERMRNLEIVPSNHTFCRIWDEWTDKLLDWARNRKKGSRLVQVCIRLKIGQWDFFRRAGMITLVFMGVHYMDREVFIWDDTPENVDKLIEEYYNLTHTA